MAPVGQTGPSGFLAQWGGKLAVFFTCTHMSHDLTTGLLPALLPFIRKDMGLTYLQAGLLISAFSLTAGFSQVLGGWLSDRLGSKKCIAVGLGGVGLSAVALGFAPSYSFMLAFLVSMGVFTGFYHPSAVSALTNHFPVRQRGKVLSLHQVGGSLGFGIGPFLGGIIADSFDWHLSYVIIGLPALACIPLVFALLKLPDPVTKPTESASTKEGEKRESLWQVFRPAAAVIAISVTMQLVNGPIMSFVSLFLVDVHHLSETASSLWVTIMRVGGLVGSLFGGWLGDEWGRRNTILLTLIVFGPAVLVLTKLPYGLFLAAALVLFGCLLPMRETTMQALLMDNTPPKLRGTVFGMYFGFGQEGSSIIQPIAGKLMDHLGIEGVYDAIALISLVLSAWAVYLAIGDYKRR